MPKSISASLKLTTQETAQFFQNKKTEILQRLEKLKTKTEDKDVLALFEGYEKSLQAADVSGMNFDSFRLLLGLVQKQMQEWRSNPAVTKTVNVELSDSINILIRFVGVIGDDLTLMKLVPENTVWVSKDVISLFNFLARETSLTPQEVQRHMNDIFWTKDNELLWQEIKDDLEQEMPDLKTRREFISKLWMKGYFWLPSQSFAYEDFNSKRNVLVWFNKFAQGCLSEWLKSRAPLAKEILNDPVFPSLLTSEALVKHENKKNLNLLKKLRPEDFFAVLEKTTRLNKSDASTIRAAIASASRSVGFVEFYGDPEHGLSRRAEVEKYFHSPALRKKLFEERLLKNVTFDALSQNSDLLLWVAKMVPEWMRVQLAQAANGNVDYFEDLLRQRLFKACYLTPAERDLFIKVLLRSATDLVPLVRNLKLLTWYTTISPLSTEEIIVTRGSEFITREAVIQHLNEQAIDETGAVSAGLKILLIYLLKCKDTNLKIDFAFIREHIQKIQALIIGNDRKDIADVLVLLMVNPLAFKTQSEAEIKSRVASLMQGRISSTRVIKQDSVFEKILGSLNDFMFIDASVFSGIVGEHLCLALAQAEPKDRVGYCFTVMGNPALHGLLLPNQMKTFVSYGSDPNKLANELLQTPGLSLSIGKCLALGEILWPNENRREIARLLLKKNKEKWLVLNDADIQRELQDIVKPPKVKTILYLSTPAQIRDTNHPLNNLDIQTILEKYFKEKEIPVNVHSPIVWENAQKIEDILKDDALFKSAPFVMPIKMKDGSWFGLAIIPHPSLPKRYTIRILNPLGKVLLTNLDVNDDIHLEIQAKRLLQSDGSPFLNDVVLPIVQTIGKISYENGDFNAVTVMHKPQDNVDPKNPVFVMGNLMAVINGRNENITRLDSVLVNDAKLRGIYADLIAPKVKASVPPISFVPPVDNAPLPPTPLPHSEYSAEKMVELLRLRLQEKHAANVEIINPIFLAQDETNKLLDVAFAKAFSDRMTQVQYFIPINISTDFEQPYWIGVSVIYDSLAGGFYVYIADPCGSGFEEDYDFNGYDFSEIQKFDKLSSQRKIFFMNVVERLEKAINRNRTYKINEIKVTAEQQIKEDGNLKDSGAYTVENLASFAAAKFELTTLPAEMLRAQHAQLMPRENEEEQQQQQQKEEIIEEVKIDSDEVVVVEVPAPPPSPVPQELQEVVLVEKNEEKDNKVEENKPTTLQAELLNQVGLLKSVKKTDEKKVVVAQEEKSLCDVLKAVLDQRRVSIYLGGDDNDSDESENEDWSSGPPTPR